jgi:hypothetical protein
MNNHPSLAEDSLDTLYILATHARHNKVNLYMLYVLHYKHHSCVYNWMTQTINKLRQKGPKSYVFSTLLHKTHFIRKGTGHVVTEASETFKA